MFEEPTIVSKVPVELSKVLPVNVNFTAITTTTINNGNSGNSGSSVYEGLGIGVVIGGIVAAFGTMLYSGTGPFKKLKLGKKAP